MTEELMIDILTGPVAALALCVFALYFIAKWLATHVPVWVDRLLNPTMKTGRYTEKDWKP